MHVECGGISRGRTHANQALPLGSVIAVREPISVAQPSVSAAAHLHLKLQGEVLHTALVLGIVVLRRAA